MRLGISPVTERVYAGKIKSNGYKWENGKVDVTEDFRKCVVLYCTESAEFEVDGMKYKATCERID